MKRTILRRLMGLILSVVICLSTIVPAFAQEEMGGFLAAAEETEVAEDNVAEVFESEDAANGEIIGVDDKAQEDSRAEELTESDDISDDQEEATVEETEEVQDASEAETEAVYEAVDVESETVEAAIEADTEVITEIESTENVAYVAESEVNLDVEFIGFGEEVDAFIREHGQDAYEIKISDSNFRDCTLQVILKTQPYVTNCVLDYLTYSDSNNRDTCINNKRYDRYFRYSPAKDNSFTITIKMFPVNYLTSGEKLSFYAYWTHNTLEGYTLCANGGVFDDNQLFDGSIITYTDGDSKNLKPLEGNDDNVTVAVTYNEDKTEAYVPVMENGFLPIPQDNGGVSMDIAGRPYDGERLPLLGWNTKSDASGEFYTGEQILLKKEYQEYKRTRLSKPVTLYAIFPEYYGAEFILGGNSYVGDYWTEMPNPDHKESLQNLFNLAVKGSEDKITKEGYNLSWFLNEDCTIPADFSTMLDDCKNIDDRLKVYGKWTNTSSEVTSSYGTVYFKNVDGAEEGVKLEVGKTLDLENYLFTREGYKFKNWTATVNGKTKTYGKNAKLNNLFKNDGEEFILTANWMINTYKIKYTLNGAKQSKTAPTNYNVETEVQLPTPAKKGYVFKGWEVKVDGKAVTDPEELAKVYDAENNKIPVGTCGNLTLSAKMVPFEYKILFHVEGQETPLILSKYGGDGLLKYTDTIVFNDAAVEIEGKLGWHETEVDQDVPNRDLKVVGFSTTEGGTVEYDRTKKYSKLSENEEEIHLYAVLENDTYYIDYHLEDYKGATLSKPIYTFKGMNKKFKLPTPTCPGYKFCGWKCNISKKSAIGNFCLSNGGIIPNSEYAVTIKDLAVKENVNQDIEVWPYFVPNTIKVYLSPNGPGVYEDTYIEIWDDYYCIPKRVAGKRFLGLVEYGGSSIDEDWIDCSVDEWYRPGYVFAGYSKNPTPKSDDEIFWSLYSDVDKYSNVVTSGSGTIYCIWEKCDYTIDNVPRIMYYEEGEEYWEECADYKTSMFPITLTYGQGVTLPKASFEGYDFLGWQIDDDYLDGSYKVTKKNGYVTAVKPGNWEDFKVYPVFERSKYNLLINTNGGTYNKRKKVTVAKGLDYSEDVSELLTCYNSKTVTRKGYKLVGFSRDAKGDTGIILGPDGKPIYKTHTLVLNGSKEVTLYAIWAKN
ncbi:MAG: InlB B-repeat-containing protein [Lachnospiraceae bacterium]|nr:InlB B-repeat-containing protein [Lachnospiraceae bacterium]